MATRGNAGSLPHYLRRLQTRYRLASRFCRTMVRRAAFTGYAVNALAGGTAAVTITPMCNSEYFLRYVRRDAGALCTLDRNGRWKQHLFSDPAKAYELVKTHKHTHQIYVTMGTLKAGANHRTVDDVESFYGFFLDLDCHGKEGEYQNIAEASAALKEFCLKATLPKPSYLVSSGRGLHAHWTFIDPIPLAQWQPVADHLKALCAAYGLKADQSVTADAARVLRVPNTLNFSDPDNPTPVELLPVAEEDEAFKDFASAVKLALAKYETGPIGNGQNNRTKSPLTVVLQKGKASDLLKLADALSYVSPDAARGNGSIFNPDGTPSNEYWLGVVMAIRREFGADGEHVTRNWSKKSARYLDGSGFDKAWAAYDPAHQKPVTIGSVYKLAQYFGWQQANTPSLPPATLLPSNPVSNCFNLLDRSAIMSQPPLRWRIKHLLPQTGIAAMYGPSGSGKSYLAIDAGVSIALGNSWFGKRVEACPVTYVILEGEAGLRNRVQAWEVHNKSKIPANFKAVTQPFALADAQQIEDLGSILPKGGVVIIDTLNRAAPGLDENSSQDMGRILAGMKCLQEITGGLVLIVHHTGKDASKGLRGHSSLYAALDGAIEVERNAMGRTWSAAKVKDGEDGVRVPFVLNVIDLGKDVDGDPITSCAVGPDTGAIFRKPEPSGKNQKSALLTIRSALSTSSTFGMAGTGSQVQCLLFEDAVDAAAEAMVGIEVKRRKQRAREAVQGLVESAHLRHGLDDDGEEWLWL